MIRPEPGIGNKDLVRPKASMAMNSKVNRLKDASWQESRKKWE